MINNVENNTEHKGQPKIKGKSEKRTKWNSRYKKYSHGNKNSSVDVWNRSLDSAKKRTVELEEKSEEVTQSHKETANLKTKGINIWMRKSSEWLRAAAKDKRRQSSK